MFKRSKVCTGVLLALGGGLTLGSLPAFAQSAERVEITGSRIKTLSTDSASPIITLSADAIKIAGATNVEDLLNSMPQVFAGYGAQVSNGSTGTATVDLRGLGPTRTLVLVNGRRLPAGDPGFSPADLNQIPTSLIKRVEVLTGGASAVYGADAVSGVVNFIMNDRFEGVQIQANRSVYNHKQKGDTNDAGVARNIQYPGNVGGDGGITDLSLTVGSNFGGDKGNATMFIGYRKQDAVTQAKRDFSSCSFGLNGNNPSGFACGGSSTSFPGRFLNTTTGASYSFDSAGAVRAYSGNRDAYNFGPINYFQRPDDRYTAAAYANYKISEMAKVYTEFNFMDDHSVAQIAPSGLFFGNTYQLTGLNPLITPAMQTALGITAGSATPVDVYIGRRNVEGGPRRDDIRHTMFRSVAGVKGDIGNWSYDVSAQVGKVIYQEEYFNDVSVIKAQRALSVVANPAGGAPVCASVLDGSDTSCVPYNIWVPNGVTQAAVGYLNTPGFKRGFTSQLVYTASGSVDLGAYGLKLPTAGSGASLAFGVESRQEKSQLETDQEFSSGDLAGQGGPTIGVGGAYSVRDVFGEFKLPLLEKIPGFESLSLTTSFRNSKYSTDKTTNTYALGVDWTVLKGYKFRGSVQKAVRSPSIIDLFSAQSIGLFNLSADPCGPNPTATLAQCQNTGLTAAQYGSANLLNSAGQYNQLTGGNPSLKPETSNSFTFGAVLQPVRDLSFTIDYFSFKVKDAISTVPPTVSLTQCLSTGNPTYCGLIHRAANGSLWTGDSFILAGNANVAGLKTSGVDLGVDYGMKLEGMGRLDFGILGTLLSKYSTEPTPGLGEYDCVGYYGNTCGTPNPKWRHTARVTWATPYDLTVSTTWRYFGKADDEGQSTNQFLAGPLITPHGGHFKAMNYIDLSVSYNVMKNFTARLGIRNLFDKDPPLAVTGAPFGNGNTYPVAYDALGRQLSLNLTVNF
jgi:outer membrane receptor protein involved in Fe transport